MKLPCVLKTTGGHIVCLFKNGFGYHLDGQYKGIYTDCKFSVAGSDKNITPEYLANTYGKVEGKEHAEFIIELAENHGFEHTIYQEKRKHFAFVDNVLIFLVNTVYDSEDKKQITIPLPPKQDGSDLSKCGSAGPFANINPDSIETMSFDFESELLKPSVVNVVNGTGLALSFDVNRTIDSCGKLFVDINITDSRAYESGCKSFKENIKEVAESAGIAGLDLSKLEIDWSSLEGDADEWPKVGDEVVISTDKEHPLTFDQLGFANINLTVISKTKRKGGVILTLEYGALGVIAILQGEWIKKPKTPEEYLRDELNECISDFQCQYHEREDIEYDGLAEYILTKYNITKKPQ